jgi:hypothetical protein
MFTIGSRGVILLLAVTFLSGCGSSPDSGIPTADGSGEGSVQEPDASHVPDAQVYAQCMRDHGVDMSDPDPATGLPQFGDAVDTSSAAVQSALEACQDLMPAGIRGESGNDDLDAYLAFSACMRENGLPDFPDPQPGAEGMFPDAGIDRNNATFLQATEACQDLLGGTGV